ncbi:hypothetical protein IE81DRAFT_332591 [Ceraceosorus guamensis]|uniref:CBM-cenC domain-containing protein n=1 Tax=Ceraceosorus guamensis TaxID=1522189 RepID=A0A316VSB8_9BASI|nr:hypothetical protein IE81DRAFT_332591 [Ceraceosorus guamensis]PWN39081.1 hypothetical protein IE81DRAFT_332591 [Ceraceosorus guamensis]
MRAHTSLFAALAVVAALATRSAFALATEQPSGDDVALSSWTCPERMPSTPNLVLNPSFETVDARSATQDKYFTEAAQWTPSFLSVNENRVGPGADDVRDGESAYDGEYFERFGTNEIISYTSEGAYTLLPGKKYILSFFARGTGGRNGVSFGPGMLLDARIDGSSLSSPVTSFPRGRPWTQYCVPGFIQGSVGAKTLSFRLQDQPGNIAIDLVALQEYYFPPVTPPEPPAKAPLGGTCTLPGDCKSNACNEGHCVANHGTALLGQYCNADAQCIHSLLFCSKRSFKCLPKRLPGSTCLRDAVCFSGKCDANGRCAPAPSKGDPGCYCSDDQHCKTGYCSKPASGHFGICKGKKPFGAACNRDAACMRGQCITQRCVPKAYLGESGDYCNNSNQCRTCRCTRQHKCSSKPRPRDLVA